MTSRGGAAGAAAVLKDVVAFVDVWSSSKTENYSKPFIEQLQDMGAEVSKTFNKRVTHVVFKHGHQSTWDKAKKTGAKLVSVLWVESCKENGEHVSEDLCPAIHEESKVNRAVGKQTKHRCMQPRDIPQRTPENDRRMKKKLDQMMKDFVPSSPLVPKISPFIIDEESGIVYSPSSRRADTMAQRLNEMKDKRENLSPTASQMVSSEFSFKKSLRDSPVASCLLYEDDEDDAACDGPFTPLQSVSSKTKAVGKKCSSDGTPSNIHSSGTNSSNTQSSRTVNRKSSLNQAKEQLSINGHTGDVVSTVGSIVGKKSRKLKEEVNKEKKRMSVGGRTLDMFFGKSKPSVVNSEDAPVKKTKVNPAQAATSLPGQNSSSKSIDDMNNDDQDCSNSPSGLKICNSSDAPLRSFVSTSSSAVKKVDQQGRSTPNPRQRQKSLELKSRLWTDTVDLSSHREDDEVFEDFFSPSNKDQKRVQKVNLTPDNDDLPSFDLGFQSRKRKRQGSEGGLIPSSSKRGCYTPGCLQKDESPVEGAPVQTVTFHPRTKKQVATKEQFGKENKRNGKEAVSSVNVNPTEGGRARSAADVNFTISEMFSVQGERDKKNKARRTLVMTSMPSEKQHTVLQVVNILGGFTLVDSVCENTTHVVAGSPRRTLNILLGIARGCWILSFEWILWCLEHRQWIPEEPYELSDHFPAAPICRLQQHLSAGEHQQDLFSSQPPMFVSPHSQPPAASLAQLIQLCGGTLCRTSRQAGLCIGEYKGKKPPGARSLSEQWVLDCLTHLKQLPYEDYDLDCRSNS